jgi:hypothetical protein
MKDGMNRVFPSKLKTPDPPPGSAPETKPEAVPTPDAIVEGPESKGRSDAPGWMTGADPISSAPSKPISPEVESVADIVAQTAKLIHHKIAIAVNYPEFEYDAEEFELTRKVFRFMLRNLPTKDWPGLIMLMSWFVMEAFKVVGLMRLRKARTPTKVEGIPEGATA